MPVANTPSSNRAAENSCARSASPTITGVIGVSLTPVLNPAEVQRAFEVPRVVPETLDALGLASRTSKAARQAAATAGGCEVENRNGRAR